MNGISAKEAAADKSKIHSIQLNKKLKRFHDFNDGILLGEISTIEEALEFAGGEAQLKELLALYGIAENDPVTLRTAAGIESFGGMKDVAKQLAEKNRLKLGVRYRGLRRPRSGATILELEIDCNDETAQFLRSRLTSTDLLEVVLKTDDPIRVRKLLLIADFYDIPVEAIVEIRLQLKTRRWFAELTDIVDEQAVIAACPGAKEYFDKM